MLIDDDPIYLYGTQRLVEIKNITKKVITATNGKEGLQFLENCIRTGQALPSLILVDISMPVMDGWQFLAKFQEWVDGQSFGKDIPVVMVSSSINHQDMQRAKSNPLVQQYVMKPITSDNLDEIAEAYWKNKKN